MAQSLPAYRRPLNAHQIQLLTTLYKFRFVSAKLIAASQGSTHVQVINSRLKILLDQEYIGRHYDSSYKIKGKQATYFLLPKGIQYLKEQPFASPKVINGLYHDKRRTEQHVSHCLNVFATYVKLKHEYRANLKFYSKSELAVRKYLPKQLPDALIVINDRQTSKVQYYFLDCYEDSNSYRQNIAKVKRYIEYAESDKWQNNIKSKLPTILMICESQLLAGRMQRLAKRELETTYVDLELKTQLL